MRSLEKLRERHEPLAWLWEGFAELIQRTVWAHQWCAPIFSSHRRALTGLNTSSSSQITCKTKKSASMHASPLTFLDIFNQTTARASPHPPKAVSNVRRRPDPCQRTPSSSHTVSLSQSGRTICFTILRSNSSFIDTKALALSVSKNPPPSLKGSCDVTILMMFSQLRLRGACAFMTIVSFGPSPTWIARAMSASRSWYSLPNAMPLLVFLVTLMRQYPPQFVCQRRWWHCGQTEESVTPSVVLPALKTSALLHMTTRLRPKL